MDKSQALYTQYELQPANRNAVRRLASNSNQVDSPTADVLITPRYKRARSGGGTFRWPDLLRAGIGSLLFAIALALTVLSKLSVISMTSRLGVNETHWEEDGSGKTGAVALYWQLLFVMVLPNVFTLLRTLVLGMCGKQTVNFPWPTKKAVIVSMVASALEVSAMCCLVFLVLTSLPTMAAVLVMNGVFVFQAGYDCTQLRWCGNGRRRKYFDDGDRDGAHSSSSSCGIYVDRALTAILENKFSRFAALVMQLSALVGMAVYIGVMDHSSEGLSLAVTLPVCLLTLSAVWCTKVQEWKNECTVIANRAAGANIIRVSAVDRPTARYKSNFINAVIRIILYPFVSYVIFRYAFTRDSIDPWCLDRTCSLARSFRWVGQDLSIFLIQILSSFFGYVFMWISCTMVLHRWGLALPMYLCTPISVGICALCTFYKSMYGLPKEALDEKDIILTLIAILLWVGQVLGKGYYIWQKRNIILGRDTDMFTNPHYDGVLLEQQVILNRDPEKPKLVKVSEKKKSRTVFVCSTMYREDSEEMKQVLSSIYTLARHCAREKEENPDHCDHFESHVFFDGGVNGTQLTHFALQLVSLLQESLKVDPKICQPHSTPYGYMLYWLIEDTVPFCIHLKDNSKIKNKKRWSQVMYMNYVLNYRVKKSDKMDDDNTFILTTDADIQFTPESAIVLLDILDSDPQVGAVCARTHPQGSGPLYWYQVFDYAIGHWFLKVAEHILGTVLCCPGCFSVFRCRALRSVLDTYSTEVTSASEFLTKDMGEDRWLCTLLVENGWRLEYCAISENYTHCPEGFEEFFKQRRRWIPSTVANLSLLITQASKVTQGNDTVSILFVLFQGVLVFSTAISPATVILVIASGFSSAYQVSDSSVIAIIVILLLLSIAYGILCLYGNPQHQLDMAKFATFVFAIIMGVVFAGNFKNIIYDIISVGRNFWPCTINATSNMSSGCHNNTAFMFPLTPSTMYLVLFTFLFIASGLFHMNEFSCLIHGVWYFLALPSGYLILLIYSVANLDDRSWGTREASSGALQGEGLGAVKRILLKVWQKLLSCFKRGASKQTTAEENKQPAPSYDAATAVTEYTEGKEQQPMIDFTDEAVGNLYHNLVNEAAFKLTTELREWLKANEFPQEYADALEKHGYFNLHFIAGLKVEDFQAIGLKDRGYVLRLERSAQKLPLFNVAITQTSLDLSDVGTWLRSLELYGYQMLFEAAGYKTREDLENLKGIKRADLQKMGINKRAHLHRLEEGILRLSYLFDAQFKLMPEVVQWLEQHDCMHHASCFEQEGYTSLLFIAGMKTKDLEAIGIKDRGIAQHLEKAAKKQPMFVLEKGIPDNVAVWLKGLHLEAYERVFASAGYRNKDDLESLKPLKSDDLKKLGITKKAHVQRLLEGISKLTYPTEVEERVHLTKRILEKVPDTKNNDECIYWTGMLDVGKPLRPLAASFKSESELKEGLRSLRNITLAALLLINVMWIVLLYTLQFPELQKYNLPTKAFEVLFLAVYALIVFVQFCAMIVHRGVTLIHYLARVEPEIEN